MQSTAMADVLRRVPLFSGLSGEQGETEWTRRVGGRGFHAVTLRAGEIFAELILFLEAPYPTTGRALTQVRLFKGHDVRLRAARENERVLVEVADDGPSIPEEIEDRIFEPFFPTEEVGAGVGLGLDIARRAVGGHGGEIRAVSEPGDTRIEVRLPVEAT